MKISKILTLIMLTLFSIVAQAQSNNAFFQDADKFFAKHVQQGAVNYETAKQDPALARLVDDIATVNLSSFDKNTRKAYLINAYNILVISQVVASYPIASVQETGPFFERTSVTVAGNKFSLTKFEKELILGKKVDPRLHFVLVCGAQGCPPITNFAYTADKLEAQLDKQTKIALNNPSFLTYKNGQLQINKIFEWYASDFGSNKQARINFVNGYRTSNRIPSSAKFKYQDYDWTLNGTNIAPSAGIKAGGGANSNRYVVSSTIPKGTAELKLFNNLFTQRSDRSDESGTRSNFFTSTFSALYGVNKRFNAGIEFKYRRVSNSLQPSSVFTVFGGGGDEVTSERSRITGIGPKIRWAPTKALPNFSVQSTIQFPVGDELTGNGTEPFIDWNGVLFNTQLFNDIAIGTRFSLFTELDFFFEDLGNEDEGRTNRFSTPVSLIFSYFPNPKTTIFALGNYSPIWQEEFDYFYQFGLGGKYQLSGDFELEVIVTDFNNKFLAESNGQAATFNLGLRYNIQ